MKDDYNWRIGADSSRSKGANSNDPRVVVKDILDLEGTVTTVGSRLIASRNEPAKADAASLEMMIDKGVNLIGKANLVELAFGTQGINPWFGTPINPIDPTLIPGGSSSGSAVAAAVGVCDFALGTDTGGSIRIPAACCGIYGLKTTWGRISTKGCYPLAPSLDTVGPLASSIDGIELAWNYLVKDQLSVDVDVDSVKIAVLDDFLTPDTSQMVDAFFAAAGVRYEIKSGIDRGVVHKSASDLLVAEALSVNEHLLIEGHRLDPAIRRRLRAAQASDASISSALEERHRFNHFLESIFDEFSFIVVPTLNDDVPTIRRAYEQVLNLNTLPFNFAMVPALSVPVSNGVDDEIWSKLQVGVAADRKRWQTPFSLQIIAPFGKEEALISYAKALSKRGVLK
ncbi:MAG: amidase [Actinomycetota bacterium]|nr:amidase [Actinomycetota bacterium]